MSVCRMFVFRNESDLDEFEISGSTYEPIGDVFYDGKVKSNSHDICIFFQVSEGVITYAFGQSQILSTFSLILLLNIFTLSRRFR